MRKRVKWTTGAAAGAAAVGVAALLASQAVPASTADAVAAAAGGVTVRTGKGAVRGTAVHVRPGLFEKLTPEQAALGDRMIGAWVRSTRLSREAGFPGSRPPAVFVPKGRWPGSAGTGEDRVRDADGGYRCPIGPSTTDSGAHGGHRRARIADRDPR